MVSKMFLVFSLSDNFKFIENWVLNQYIIQAFKSAKSIGMLSQSKLFSIKEILSPCNLLNLDGHDFVVVDCYEYTWCFGHKFTAMVSTGHAKQDQESSWHASKIWSQS